MSVIWGQYGKLNILLWNRGISWYSEVQSEMFRFSTMPEIDWCKVINLIHNRHFSTHRPNYIFSLYLKEQNYFHQNFYQKDYTHEKSERPPSNRTSKSCHAQTSSDARVNCIGAQYPRARSHHGAKFSVRHCAESL